MTLTSLRQRDQNFRGPYQVRLIFQIKLITDSAFQLSLREANIYNIHYDKHILGAVRILDEKNDGYHVQTNYSLYQTSQDGVSELFSVGTYRDLVIFDGGKPIFREKIAVVDTFGIPRLLSTPI